MVFKVEKAMKACGKNKETETLFRGRFGSGRVVNGRSGEVGGITQISPMNLLIK